jgi:PDZ domain
MSFEKETLLKILEFFCFFLTMFVYFNLTSMKKIYSWLLIFGLTISSLFIIPSSVYALNVKVVLIDIANGKTAEENTASSVLTKRDVFQFLLQLPTSIVKTSYQYIDLKYTNISKTSKDYVLLQKMVYLNYLENKKGSLFLDSKISASSFYTFVEKVYGENVLSQKQRGANQLKKRYANTLDIEKVKSVLIPSLEDSGTGASLADPIDRADIAARKAIFNDVYNSLVDTHYNYDTLDHKAMIYSAIEWLAKGTWDKHTVFFPPTKSKSFEDSLAWEFEWIGAYVDMKEPWVVNVISPIPDSPAEKAWVKAGDIILKIGNNLVTPQNSLQEVVGWIKWPSGTSVILHIKRWENELDISVVRERIIIKEIEYAFKWGDTFYIKMKTFW